MIEFDPKVITYEELVVHWSKMHSLPTYRGTRQYRSALFYSNDVEKEICLEAMERLVASKSSNGRKVFMDVEPVGPFYRAEEYHQDYLVKQGLR